MCGHMYTKVVLKYIKSTFVQNVWSNVSFITERLFRIFAHIFCDSVLQCWYILLFLWNELEMDSIKDHSKEEQQKEEMSKIKKET